MYCVQILLFNNFNKENDEYWKSRYSIRCFFGSAEKIILGNIKPLYLRGFLIGGTSPFSNNRL